jgi:tetratricopeptide (TPR) repeat protein
MFNLAAVL